MSDEHTPRPDPQDAYAWNNQPTWWKIADLNNRLVQIEADNAVVEQ